jgi:hypothetical protein
MRELRVSIPFIGGVTAIYTRDEIDAKKAKLKASTSKAIQTTSAIAHKSLYKSILLIRDGLNALAGVIEPKEGR